MDEKLLPQTRDDLDSLAISLDKLKTLSPIVSIMSDAVQVEEVSVKVKAFGIPAQLSVGDCVRQEEPEPNFQDAADWYRNEVEADREQRLR